MLEVVWSVFCGGTDRCVAWVQDQDRGPSRESLRLRRSSASPKRTCASSREWNSQRRRRWRAEPSWTGSFGRRATSRRCSALDRRELGACEHTFSVLVKRPVSRSSPPRGWSTALSQFIVTRRRLRGLVSTDRTCKFCYMSPNPAQQIQMISAG